MKILDSIPICIGELQLVWEDKPSATDLASVRLYFLPECTPDGRQPTHGEDEVLAYYEKIVLKLTDLASMVVHNVSWSDGRRAFTCARDSKCDELAEAFKMNSYGLDNRDVEKEKDAAEGQEMIEDISPEVVIMTYPRYCRYRCMLKRLENCEDKWLHKSLVCALGGFSSMKENNRVYFCKDIFEHADLDDFELRCDHLAPNLKGRPRKRKGSKRDPNDSSDDSSSSSSFSAQPEINAANKVRTGSRATPLRNGFRIDKINVSKDEQAFLIELHKYMKSRNTPIGRIPSLGFKQIDLFQFYTLAEEIGGYEQITAKRLWKNIYDALGGNPGSTSAATYTRRHYEKLLLPFERYKSGKEFKPIQHKKKKFRIDNNLFLSQKVKVSKQLENTEVKVKSEAKIKTETKVKSELENGNGDTTSIKEKVDFKDKALIIKQEIEKMKMRKDARKHGTSIMNKTNTKVTGTLEKKKSSEECKKSRWGEKGRRPSGGQKTVRELLHQNGHDSSEVIDGNSVEKVTDHKQKGVTETEEGKVEKLDSRETVIPSIPQVVHTPASQIDTKSLPPQPILPSLNAPRPMFYPQLIPVGGAIRNMTPIGMPFMIGPQFGFQTVSNQMQTMQAIGGAPGVKDEKPLNALNKLVSEQSTSPSVGRNAVSSHPGKNNLPLHITPPSAHSSQTSTKGPLISPPSGPQAHRPITPAHSHNSKRQYPYPDTNRNHPTYSSNYCARDVKQEPVSNLDLKRQKLHGSQEKQYQSSNTNEFDMPVLDLSMKTLRAQEARHQRGESLLFNTSFNKENRTGPKSEHCDAPQDLSLKSKTNLGGNERQPNVNKSVPLNIPFPWLPTVSTPMKKEEDVRKERLDFQPPSSSKQMLPISSSSLTTIGGLPVDLSSFVHPAFPQQMLMQGVFPTPLQLQQMIQGQVAAGMPMLRPDFIPSPLMFPPNMSVVAPTMFTNVMPSVAKTSTNPAPIVKR